MVYVTLSLFPEAPKTRFFYFKCYLLNCFQKFQDSEPNAPYYDPANITQCKAFLDAKRKLRLVLSSAANIPTNTASHTTNTSSLSNSNAVNNLSQSSNENDL